MDNTTTANKVGTDTYSTSPSTTTYTLELLKNLDDWKVHEDDTDVRGWNLYANGVNIGEITNLVASPALRKVQYLEVELDDSINDYRTAYRNNLIDRYTDYYGSDEDRRIIVPVGMVRIDNSEGKVIASPNLTPEIFSTSPRFNSYSETNVTPRTELLTVKHYTADDDYYRDYYNTEEYEDVDNYVSHSFTPSHSFYSSDLFNHNQYFGRHRNSRPNMVRYKTDAPSI